MNNNIVRKTILDINGEEVCVSTVRLNSFYTHRKQLPTYETMVFGGEHDQDWFEPLRKQKLCTRA